MQANENDEDLNNDELTVVAVDDSNSTQEECCNTADDDIANTNEPEKINVYVAKKPRWWKAMAGRRGTNSQRKAIASMTQKGYVIPSKLGYQPVIDLSRVFELPRGKALSVDAMLAPKLNDEHEVNLANADHVVTGKHMSVEIGFGLGDNILTNASKFPNQYFIGAEIHQPGVGTALSRMETAIEADTYWLDQTWVDENDLAQIEERQRVNDNDNSSSKPYDNLRIYPGDGVKLLGFLPNNSMDCIYLTFPDPWPQEDQHHWRVIQENTVAVIGRVLKPAGCFYLATDSLIVDEWIVMIFAIVQEKNREEFGVSRWEEVAPCPDRGQWLPAISKYEEKGVAEGRYTVCRCWKHVA